MPNVNLSDARMRDAVVKAESTRRRRTIFYQGPKKLPAYTRKVLKGAVHQDYESMLEKYKTPEALGAALAEGDPEICLLYTSPSPRDRQKSRMPSSA